MEKPGIVNPKLGRVKFVRIILPSLILLIVIIVTTIQFKKEKTMPTHGSVKGIINKAGKPVADAIVMIKEGSHEFNDIASVTNESGEFYLSNIVIPGRYVLLIQHDSGSITKEINVQSADSIIRVSY